MQELAKQDDISTGKHARAEEESRIDRAAITKDLWDRIRSQIQHEDTLVNQRLTWLLIAEAFLFTGYHGVLNAQRPENRTGTLIGIAVFGILLAIASYSSILAAFKSLRRLHDDWYQYQLFHDPKSVTKEELEKDLLNQGYPLITWRGDGLFTAVSAATGFPALIMITWGFLIGTAIFDAKLDLSIKILLGFIIVADLSVSLWAYRKVKKER